MERKTQFEDLPLETLVQILKNLTSGELVVVQSVCREFRKIVTEFVGFELELDDRYTAEYREFVFGTGVSNCVVDRYLVDGVASRFRRPHMVRKIVFENFITLPNFESILYPLSSLHDLSLDFKAMCVPELTVNGEFFAKSSLGTLRLDSRHYLIAVHFVEGYNCQIQDYIKNFLIIMKSLNSTKLKTLELSCPLWTSAELEINNAVFGCLSRNGATLRNLTFSWACRDRNEPSNRLANGQQWNKFNWKNFNGIRLEKLGFYCCCHNELRHESDWRILMRFQLGLSRVYYSNKFLATVPQPFFIDTAGYPQFANLTVISIFLPALDRFAQYPIDYLDCHVFAGCVNLTHFLIQGEMRPTALPLPPIANMNMGAPGPLLPPANLNIFLPGPPGGIGRMIAPVGGNINLPNPFNANPHIRPVCIPGIRNLKSLPGTHLKVVSLVMVNVASVDLDELVNWPNLQDLRLFNVANFLNHGVKVKTLVDLMAPMKMVRVHLDIAMDYWNFWENYEWSFKLEQIASSNRFNMMLIPGEGELSYFPMATMMNIDEVDDEGKIGKVICIDL